MKHILFLSNGYGEDTISSFIIDSLKQKIDTYNISAFPLVGTGKSYTSFNIHLRGPMKEMPSQGDLHSVSRILQDIRTGL